MKLDETKWKATYKRVVEKTGMAPSDGVVCALATILYIKAEMLADLRPAPEDEDVRACLSDGLAELAQHITGKLEGCEKPKLLGFAGNASAAAKAAGFKASEKDEKVDVDALFA